MKKIKIKINKPLKNHPEGQIIDIPVSVDNVPLDRYWRDRLKDACIDGCVEIVKDSISKKDDK